MFDIGIKRTPRRCALLFGAIASVTFPIGTATAQVVDPYYDNIYWIFDLGSVPGLPTSYGGLCFKYDDSNTLLIGGYAETGSGAIYSVQLERDCYGQIIGFAGDATHYATAAYITGGLCYGPDNVLFLHNLCHAHRRAN